MGSSSFQAVKLPYLSGLIDTVGVVAYSSIAEFWVLDDKVGRIEGAEDEIELSSLQAVVIFGGLGRLLRAAGAAGGGVCACPGY